MDQACYFLAATRSRSSQHTRWPESSSRCYSSLKARRCKFRITRLQLLAKEVESAVHMRARTWTFVTATETLFSLYVYEPSRVERADKRYLRPGARGCFIKTNVVILKLIHCGKYARELVFTWHFTAITRRLPHFFERRFPPSKPHVRCNIYFCGIFLTFYILYHVPFGQ